VCRRADEAEDVDYSYRREASREFAQIVGAVERSIRAHGFSVERVHDIQATLASKGFDIEPLRIYEITGERPLLGDGLTDSDHPDHERLELLMPCRVNVFVEDDFVVVAAVRPTVMCWVFPEAELDDLARAVEAIVVELVDEAVA
jgi:uncharacterized protein (DUF302 family)